MMQSHGSPAKRARCTIPAKLPFESGERMNRARRRRSPGTASGQGWRRHQAWVRWVRSASPRPSMPWRGQELLEPPPVDRLDRGPRPLARVDPVHARPIAGLPLREEAASSRRRDRARRRTRRARRGRCPASRRRCRRCRRSAPGRPSLVWPASGRRAGARARRLAPEARADPLDRFLRLVAAAEGGEPEVALAARAEADARGADDVGLGEQPVEEVPGAEARAAS